MKRMDDEVMHNQEVLGLAAAQKWGEVRERVKDWSVADLSDLLAHVEGAAAALMFRALPRAKSALVFANLDSHDQEGLLEALGDAETKRILEELPPDDRTAVFEELPAQVTRRLFLLLPPEELAETRSLLGYPPESVGRLMTPGYVSVRPEWSLAQALDHIRRTGQDSETISLVYVTDEAGKLLDDLRLRSIILANPQAVVRDLMDDDVVALNAFQDREEAVRELARQDVMALPVTDSDGVLLGIVTHDDVFDVAEEEATEDMQIAASVAPLRQSYRHAGVGLLYRRRVAWLAGLVVLSLASSVVLRTFVRTIEEVVALVFFIPLIMSSGGNTGSQSATLTVRALATDDLGRHEWGAAVTKELLVGLLLGVTLGVLAGLVGLVLHVGTEVGLVVGITMCAVVLVANLLGVGLPLLLDRLGADPAVASAPLISVMLDSMSLLIYLGTAVWVFS